MIEYFEDASAVFKEKKKELASIKGIVQVRAKYLKDWDAFKEMDDELLFTDKHHIEMLFITDKGCPQRLLHSYHPPTLLYYRGTINLNSSKIISIIGTCNHTEYGKQVTEQLIASLQTQRTVIVSGLAYGIDAMAHKTSLQHQLPTIGVLANGLNIIYPAQHRGLAKDLLLQGGLLKEF